MNNLDELVARIHRRAEALSAMYPHGGREAAFIDRDGDWNPGDLARASVEAICAIQAMVKEREAVCKTLFLDGHAEGWRGNQLRRDAQHIDAEKSWGLYVRQGALAKAASRALTAMKGK